MANIAEIVVQPKTISNKIYRKVLKKMRCDTEESLEQVGFSAALISEGFEFILDVYGDKQSNYKLFIGECVYRKENPLPFGDGNGWEPLVLSAMQKEILQNRINIEVKYLQEVEDDLKKIALGDSIAVDHYKHFGLNEVKDFLSR